MKKVTIAILLAVFLFLSSTFSADYSQLGMVKAETTFLGWQVAEGGGNFSEDNGEIILSGNDMAAGTSLRREFTPRTDFELSFQLKADTLGEVHRDPNGAGEGFSFGFGASNGQTSHGVSIEMRARAGGQFLLVWHNKMCDLYGWACDWKPFVYNALGYNDGSAFWHLSSSDVKANAPVQPDSWYTLKLIVKESPFTVTGEVYSENNTFLGALTIDDMNDFTFDEITYVAMSSGFGGTFHIKDITGIPPLSKFAYSPSQPTVYTPTMFDATAAQSDEQIINYSWNFGDGNVTSTSEPTIFHTYEIPEQYTITLTVTDNSGYNSSITNTIKVLLPTYLSIFTDASTNLLGSIININGQLATHNGIGIENELVTLYYRFPGVETWTPLGSDYTDKNGNYDIQWINSATGTITVESSWRGNETHAESKKELTFCTLPNQNQNIFCLESNSTITSFDFNSESSMLTFTASGPTGTRGYAKITIDKALIQNPEKLEVKFDGKQFNYTIDQTANSWQLNLLYSHSIHQFSIQIPKSSMQEGNEATVDTNYFAETNEVNGPSQSKIGNEIFVITVMMVLIAVGGVSVVKKCAKSRNLA